MSELTERWHIEKDNQAWIGSGGYERETFDVTVDGFEHGVQAQHYTGVKWSVAEWRAHCNGHTYRGPSMESVVGKAVRDPRNDSKSLHRSSRALTEVRTCHSRIVNALENWPTDDPEQGTMRAAMEYAAACLATWARP